MTFGESSPKNFHFVLLREAALINCPSKDSRTRVMSRLVSKNYNVIRRAFQLAIELRTFFIRLLATLQPCFVDLFDR
jgi:hypothetical protein